MLGVCVGAALAGQRPIGEMQFNDFVATGFNQLVNNAAKIRYRWGGDVPMVVRMPWGGLRYAGPYHTQNTEPWFYRTPGLKIVVPSTPEDARALMAAAVADPDPVLYYEHIALYRDPRIKQALPAGDAPAPMPIGKAALRRAGDDLAMISYGAYVHACLRVAETLAADGIEAAVLDLRTLVAARPRRRARRRAPLQPRADRPRRLAHRRHRREPRRDHPGRSVRVARRPGPHPRRARHAGAVLAAARGVLSGERGGDRAGGAAARGVLTATCQFPVASSQFKARLGQISCDSARVSGTQFQQQDQRRESRLPSEFGGTAVAIPMGHGPQRSTSSANRDARTERLQERTFEFAKRVLEPLPAALRR